MMRKPENIEAISCKNCSANIPLLGNIFRSKNLCCAYCGTIMDSQNEFKALYSFTHIQKPNSPLFIGMQGKVQNVNFTITGYIAYKYREEEWMHFQLYSPTQGYAFLMRRNNKYLFLRKTYHLPDKNLWTLKQGDSFSSQQKTFQVESFYMAEVFYAAGNLITSIDKSKRSKQCFSQSGKQCFLSVQKKDIVEYYSGYEIADEMLEKSFA